MADKGRVLAGGRHELIDRDELLGARHAGETVRAWRKVAKTDKRTSAKADPDLCWNCGKPGAVLGFVSDRRNCPDCEVTWAPEWSATRGDLNYVCWMGTVIFCVDFTKPESLGAPA